MQTPWRRSRTRPSKRCAPVSRAIRWGFGAALLLLGVPLAWAASRPAGVSAEISAEAAPGTLAIRDDGSSWSLTEHMEVLYVTSRELSFEQVRSPPYRDQFRASVPNELFPSKGATWARIRLHNAGKANRTLILTMSSVILDFVDWYQEDGTRTTTGGAQSWESRISPVGLAMLRLEVPAGATRVLYWRSYNDGTPIHVTTVARDMREHQVFIVVRWGMTIAHLAVALILSFYCLVLAIGLREGDFLAYPATF